MRNSKINLDQLASQLSKTQFIANAQAMSIKGGQGGSVDCHEAEPPPW